MPGHPTLPKEASRTENAEMPFTPRNSSMPIYRPLLRLLCGLSFCVGGMTHGEAIEGPLRIHPQNPRYFTNDSGRAILLTGSHTWNNLVDMGPTDPPRRFDYDAYLDWLTERQHNFFRLWTWELLSWNTEGNREKDAAVHFVTPHPWKRTGPDQALDGKPKFDLTEFNDEYFSRLRYRVQAAHDRGIYLSVMLFEGWGIQFSPNAWQNHPFHPANNINGIDGDLNGDGRGLEIHTGQNRSITALQQEYVRQVVDAVNEFDNVLYEISNENHPASTEWQYGMIRWIRQCESRKAKQHPVGMTFQYKGGQNRTLFDSPADWISPNSDGGYRDDPPVADGSKVIITDTDHLWGIGGNADWVWKSFLRGMHPIFMDPYDGRVLRKGFGTQQADPIRRSMGAVLDWSRRVNLAELTPQPELASTKYCLANPGVEYLVLVPASEQRLTMSLPSGRYEQTWFRIDSQQASPSRPLDHAGGTWTADERPTVPHLLHLRR